jgi:SRSO17 transposase
MNKGGTGGTRAEVHGNGGAQTAGADEQYAYFLCYHRLDTTLGELIQIAGRRWGIEESFAIAKSETGLDEHQVRRWKAWYRHAILSMLAAAFLAAMRARLPANPTAWQAG